MHGAGRRRFARHLLRELVAVGVAVGVRVRLPLLGRGVDELVRVGVEVLQLEAVAEVVRLLLVAVDERGAVGALANVRRNGGFLDREGPVEVLLRRGRLQQRGGRVWGDAWDLAHVRFYRGALTGRWGVRRRRPRRYIRKHPRNP